MIKATSFQPGNGWPAGAISLIGSAARPYNLMSKEMSMDFWAQYEHPQWQKKRLEALEAAGFECQSCSSTDKQLNVHHKQYFRGRKVWEYAIDELIVLCKDCHKEQHKVNDLLKEVLAASDSSALASIVGLLIGYLGLPTSLLDDSELGGLEQFEAEMCIPVGVLARTCGVKLSTGEMARLKEAVSTLPRVRGKTGEIRIETDIPTIGFFSD